MDDKRQFSTALLCGAGLLLTTLPLHADGNVAAPPESRYRIERAPEGPTKADTGYFVLWPNDPPPADSGLRVVSKSGAEVGHQVLWAAEGEPTKILFDCSGQDAPYYVSILNHPVNPPDWTPPSGLILETRVREPGDPTNLPSLRQTCQASSPVLGRSLIPNIFLGIHPHGPTASFVSIVKGVFSVDKAGEYAFATISEDASCLFVDGKIVAGWYGWHGIQGGRHGQYHGRVTLAAGRHTIEYLNAASGDAYTIEAAWRPPGDDGFSVMPGRSFPPVARYRVAGFEPGPSEKTPIRFKWDITGHFTIGAATFINVKFQALTDGERYEWSFDDGTKALGSAVEHVFLSPGMRGVTLQAQRNGQVTSLTRKIRVHPLWTQETEQPRHLYKEERHRLAREDLGAAPVADLVGAYRIAADEEDLPMAGRFAALCLARAKEVDKDQAGVFSEMAMFVQRPDMQEYSLAEQAFRIVIGSPYPSPEQKAWASLHLAGLLVHYVGRPDEADPLLKTIDADKLSDTDKRLKRIYEADVLFANGHVEAARDVFASIGTSYAPGDTGQALKRSAQLETARDYLRRGEFDDAEQMIRCIEWEAPEQRVAGEPGLVMIKVCMGRREFARALILARKLLPVAETDARKAEILLATTEICLALNQNPDAAKAYHQLLEAYPYSEAAATAKDKWSGKLDANNK